MSSVVNHVDARHKEAAARVANAYGHFTPDGREFHITDVRTPRPWVNIIANPRFGLAVSHTGSGFTWVDNSQLAVITRWQQDLCRDSSGKFLYVRDADKGDLWSLSPAPVWAPLDDYACHHGLGYSTFVSEFAGIRARWTLFCDPIETLEYWLVDLENMLDRPRRLEVCAFLEWCVGVSPSPRREFHKLFIETQFDPRRGAIYASNHMWDVPTERHGHWNASFPYVSALAGTEPLLSAQGDMAAFLGRYGKLDRPVALAEDTWRPAFGRHEDPIAALRSLIELRRGERRRFGYVLAVGTSRDAVNAALDKNASVAVMDQALEAVRKGWDERLAAQRIETPEPSIDYLTNDWLRYQAIAGRIWGRCGYYQQSGAFGFRDQLQDSQVWLTIAPEKTREQINLHARHQFADGSVYHWWHPLTEQGLVTRMTDDLLWLGFVTAAYIKETGDLSVLDDKAPFLDEEQPLPLREHVRRAFERVFRRTSPRGLPYIGAGDWNDGLSAAGLQEKGESIWLGQFLAGLLADWAEIHRRAGQMATAEELTLRREQLVKAINTHGWDGQWYYRATLDDGSKLGSASSRVGRIFLNAQTWAILNNVAPPERARQCLDAVREHLVSKAGALLLAPAFDAPVPEIGYITRYAPGLRENGGVYTHAATWAIAAACKMHDAELVEKLLTAINPANKDPEAYWAEPYVLPGNVDGPQSPHHGRGGWTWYTGSAAWLQRIVTHWVLGVRPEWEGLVIDPCLPKSWSTAGMTRPWRGNTYIIRIERDGSRSERGGTWSPNATPEVTVDGKKLPANVILPPKQTGRTHDVRVRCR